MAYRRSGSMVYNYILSGFSSFLVSAKKKINLIFKIKHNKGENNDFVSQRNLQN